MYTCPLFILTLYVDGWIFCIMTIFPCQVSRLNPDAHDGLYGQKPLSYNLPLKQLHSHKAISLPSSPQRFSKKGSLMSDTPEIFMSPDMMSTFSKVLQSSKFLNQPLLPFEEWNIDFSEITIGARVGIGMYGFRLFLGSREFSVRS